MALQDDIIGLLSNIGEAGDRATARQERGIELYENIGEILGDSPNYRRALRELTGLGSRGEDMTLEEEMRSDAGLADRVASIIEKYMADAATIGQVPDDMIVDDTRAAERMMEVMSSPDTAPRTPVTVEPIGPIAPLPGRGPGEAGMLMVDDAGAAMQGRGMDQIREEIMSAPRIQEAMAQEIVDGARNVPGRAADLQEAAIRMMENQARQEGVYGPQSARLRAAAGEETGLSGALLAGRMGREATPEDEVSAILDSLVYGGAPLGGVAALSSGVLSRLAMRLGVGRFSPQQIARNPQLRLQIEQEVRLALPKPTPGAPSSYVVPSAQVGAQARQAAQAAARTRQAAAARARQAARGERSGPDIPITPSPAQRLGSTQGSGSAFDDLINRLGPIGMAGGMSVRDNILRNYAMMADGGSGADAMVKVYSTSGERLTDDEDRINAMNRRMREDKIPLILSDYELRNDPDLRLLNKARKASSRADWQRYIDQQNSR
jgi:hypothetical protein